jgi:homing endonuclease-like protein
VNQPRWAAQFMPQAIACRDEACLVWPFYRRKDGRAQIWDAKRGRSIPAHFVVCEEAKGPRPSPDHDASHLCGNGSGGCVNGSHLAWETRRENTRRELGKHPMRKLTEKEVREIRLLSAMPVHLVAINYGVSVGAIKFIWSGKRWGWLP